MPEDGHLLISQESTSY